MSRRLLGGGVGTWAPSPSQTFEYGPHPAEEIRSRPLWSLPPAALSRACTRRRGACGVRWKRGRSTSHAPSPPDTRPAVTMPFETLPRPSLDPEPSFPFTPRSSPGAAEKETPAQRGEGGIRQSHRGSPDLGEPSRDSISRRPLLLSPAMSLALRFLIQKTMCTHYCFMI